MRKQGQCIVLLALASVIRCDDLFIINSPTGGIDFVDKVTEIKSNQLEEMLDIASGVTTSKGGWQGVRVLSPFRYPRVVSVLTVQVAEPLPAPKQWRHLDVSGPAVEADAVFHQLDVGLAKQPNTMPSIKLEVDEEDGSAAPPAVGALNGSTSAERLLLRELALLDEAGRQLPTQLAGRRAVLLSLQALPAVTAEQPAAAAAAGRQLAAAAAQYADRLAAATGDRALTVLLAQSAPSRHARSLLDATEAPPVADTLNLASSYSDDYPVIFNILLITSLFLLYILVAFSVMTAYMDPGKDSIIYRMTNPNMKKNN